VVSAVFLEVWRRADRFEARSTVSTRLLAIAHFKALFALQCRRDEGGDEESALRVEDLGDDSRP
jgi:RNA polymerase sigma-70 factor, ECF subfamily